MNRSDESKNGWNEYSKLVIKELESLALGIKELSIEIQYIKKEIAEMRVREDRVEDLREWKNAIDEIASPTQMQVIVNDVEDLKQFKTKSVTIFMVVQFLMGAALAMAKLY